MGWWVEVRRGEARGNEERLSEVMRGEKREQGSRGEEK